MKNSKKIIFICLIFVILFYVPITQTSIAVEEVINSSYYEVDNENNIIGRIEPETKVEEFKQKMNIDGDKLKIYQDDSCMQEITTGFVGTGMVLKYITKEYKISVVGDFDKDGKATQVELTNIIRHIVGLQNANLEGIYYKSADLTGDGLVDQRDITKYIKYIVFGELDLGKVDITPPELTLTVEDIQADSAKIIATAIDKEMGMGDKPTYTFYLKKENEEDSGYKEVQEDTNNILILNNLLPNTEYRVKVVTYDKAGNRAEKNIKLKTLNIEGTLIFDNVIWNEGKASINITSESNYIIEYQINSDTGIWTEGGRKDVTINNLNNNDTIYARLTDGINICDMKSIKIEDKIVPDITLSLSQTTSTIVATAHAVDKETGIAEEEEYVFYIKENDGEYIEKQKNTNGICTIINLKANSNYTIKVQIKDKAGNIATKEQGITTEKIPNADYPGSIIFSSVTWKNGKAQVTITTTTDYTVEYQVNGILDEGWTQATTGERIVTINNLNNNDVIYARLTDGTNVGSYISQTVYDGIAPNITLTLNTDTQKITAVANAIDNESGISQNVTYKFSIKNTGEDDSTYVEKQNITSNKCEFTNLIEGKDYTIKVEVVDNAGNIGIKEESVEIPDDIAPIVNLTITEKTSNAIKALAEAIDIGGMPENPIYVFYIKKTGEPDTSYTKVQSGENTVCTFKELATNTDYTIKVTVKDNAENEGMKEISCLTDKIPNGTEIGAITFSSITWSNGNATVTISSTTKYTIEYQVNSINEENWTVGTIVSNLKHGDIIYARLTDGTNTTSPATLNIVDSIKPQVKLDIAKQISKVTVTTIAEDLESGMDTNTIYKFSIKKVSEPDSSYVLKQATNSNVCNITKLEQETNYMIKVEVQDIAGNIAISTQNVITDKMMAATGAITFEKSAWVNQSVDVTMTTNTQYYIEYQINSIAGTWIRASEIGALVKATGLKHNDIVYARLTDGTNAGDYASVTIVDLIEPESFEIEVTDITYEGFKIKGSTIDKESGIRSYTYVVEKREGESTDVSSTKAKGYNVNSISNNNNNINNTSRSCN